MLIEQVADIARPVLCSKQELTSSEKTGVRATVFQHLAGIVLLEVAVLLINGWRCPLTIVAERYTTDRRHNFDGSRLG